MHRPAAVLVALLASAGKAMEGLLQDSCDSSRQQHLTPPQAT
jgi:hypothetical protein